MCSPPRGPRPHGGRQGRDGDGPMSFRDFMGELPHDVTPEAAKAEYDAYMAQYFGDVLRAEFEQRKGDPL